MKYFTAILLLAITFGCGNNPTTQPNPVSFEWDFANEKTYVYSYSQNVTTLTTRSKGSENAERSDIEAKGQLHVRVKEENMADVSMQGVSMNMVNYDSTDTPTDTFTTELPVSVQPSLKANGTFANASESNIALSIVFPLPGTALKEGESFDYPMSIPFNANGSNLEITGQNRLTFAGYTTFEGKNCAQLKGDIDISSLEIPQEITGKYESSTQGEAVYYFDTENGYLQGTDIELTMKLLMDASSDENKGRSLYSDNLTTISQSIRFIETKAE